VKLLLDTHIILWARLEPDRLGGRVAAALEDTDNELWFSPVSVWEMLLLAQRGRIDVKGDVYKWVDRMVADMNEAVLNRHVAAQSRRVEVPHEDPADRFLAATANVYKLQLVTSDSKLQSVPGLKVFR
jgi:PIN domain nuclease of toxin-antitoxin system